MSNRIFLQHLRIVLMSLSLMVLCVFNSMFSQNHTTIRANRSGTGNNSLVINGIAEVFEPNRFNNGTKSLSSTYYIDHRYTKLQNIVELKINREALKETNIALQEVEITFELDYYKFDIQVTTPTITHVTNETHTLSVKFNPATHAIDKEIDIFVQSYQVASSKLKVTQIKVNGIIRALLTTDIPVLLTNTINADIDEGLGLPVSLNPMAYFSLGTTCQNDLTIGWASFPGAKSYELEYVLVDYWVKTKTAYHYDFKNNSTRIQLNSTNYSFPLIYEKGYILYRIKAHGFNYNGSEWETSETDWTMPDRPNASSGCYGPLDLTNGSINSCNGFGFVDLNFSFGGFEPDKNWQYAISFAENAKSMGVISYSDGTLRNRQSISVMNSENKAMVGQTIYDFWGRPAIQPLSVPDLSNSSYCFRPNFNKSRLTHLQYDWKDFDVDYDNSCMLTKTSEMDWQHSNTNSGASWYYSEKNALVVTPVENYDRYIPFADGYPFAQTEYTQDNTGRVKRISGVGKQHRLKGHDDAQPPVLYSTNTHETRYLYGTPTQSELYRIFGNEIGLETHYEKNLVIDPNGQGSVAYLDHQGRTIATALIGNTNGINRPLPGSTQGSIQSPKDITYTFTNMPVGSEQYTLEVSKDYLVTNDGIHEFEYTVTPEILSKNCMPEGICFTCVYDLTISILDECRQEKIPGGVITRTVGNIDPNIYNNGCTAIPFTLSFAPLSVNLAVGKYTVIKKLTVNRAAYEYYLKQFLAENDCVKTIEDFVAEEELLINARECNYTCETCNNDLAYYNEKLNIINDRIANYQTDVLSLEALNAIKTDLIKKRDQTQTLCKEICEPKNTCEQVYEAMLKDFVPGNQYAQYLDNVGDISYTIKYSILNTTSNALHGSSTHNWHWRIPIGDYINDDGSIALIEIVDNKPEQVSSPVFYDKDGFFYSGIGSQYIKPQDLKNEADFIMYFLKQVNWAKALVTYHPEYPCWEKCEDIKQYYDYDVDMRNTETFSDADDKGYLNPIKSSNQGGSVEYEYDQVDPIHKDNTGALQIDGNFLSDLINNKLHNIITHDNVTYTAWEMLELYRATVDETDGDCANDLLWAYFRTMYLNAKQEVLIQYYGTCGGKYNIINTDIPKVKRFLLNTNVSDLLKTSLSEYNQSIFNHDPANLKNNVILNPNTGQLALQCDETCTNYADAWMEKLSACENSGMSTAGLKDAVRQALIDVCKDGCDEGHGFGSTTINPVLTNKPYKSFHDVLTNFSYNGSTYNFFSKGVCDELLIEWPMPYDHDYFAYEKWDAKNCACDNSRFEPANIAAKKVDCPSYEPEGVEFENCACSQTDEAKRNVLLLTKSVPKENRCNTCYTCVEVYNAAQYYHTEYYDAIPISNPAFPGIITAFMNRFLKMNLTYPEYKEFIAKCYDVEAAIDDRAWDSVFFNQIRFGVNDLNVPAQMPQIENTDLRFGTIINYELWNSHIRPTLHISFNNNIDNNLTASLSNDIIFPFIESETAMNGPSDNIKCHCKKILNAWKTAEESGRPFEDVLDQMYPGHGFVPTGNASNYKTHCLKLFNGYNVSDNVTLEIIKYPLNGEWTPAANGAVDNSYTTGTTGAMDPIKDLPCTDDPNDAKKGDLKKLDPCACEKILNYKNDYDNLPPNTYSSFDEYMKQVKRVSSNPGFDKLYKKCLEYYRTSLGEDNNGDPADWDPLVGFNQDAKDHLKKDVDFWDYKVADELLCTNQVNPPCTPMPCPPKPCDVDCKLIRNFIAEYLLTNSLPSANNFMFPGFSQAEKVYKIWDYLKTNTDPDATTWMNGMKDALNAFMDNVPELNRCKPHTYTVDKIMELLAPCLPPCPSLNCEALNLAVLNFITARQMYNITNPGNIKYIPETFLNLDLDKMGGNMGVEMMNYDEHNHGEYAMDRPWTDMSGFMNDFLSELNTNFSNSPFCTRNFTIKQITDLLIGCNPKIFEDPLKQSPCKICFRLNKKYKLTDLQAFLNRISKGDGGTTNSGIDQFDKSNWKIENSPSRDVTEYYNSSLYTGGTDVHNLRYLTAGYPVPPQINVSVQDNSGHLNEYTLYFPGDETYFHWGEIIKFSNIRIPKPPACTIPKYFLVDVEIFISQIEYDYFHTKTGITLTKVPITIDQEPTEYGYRYTITMTGAFINTPLSYKMKCPGPCYTLCNRPIVPDMVLDLECDELQKVTAFNNAQIRYNTYIRDMKIGFENDYYAKCMGVNDLFKSKYKISEYHYTLYYYDRAGSLIKTVPPQGVDVQFMNQAQLDARILQASNFTSGLSGSVYQFTDHNLITYYRYNTLGQLIWHKTPDAGVSKFWYDKLGRITASQNAKQRAKSIGNLRVSSYSKYDAQGRIIEVGEKTYDNTQYPELSYPLFAGSSNDLANNFYAAGTNTEVTRTYYDNPLATEYLQWAPYTELDHKNTRKRVLAMAYLENGTDINSATHYSYDTHGDIIKLWQYIPALEHLTGQKLKTFDYDFDLISGNVNVIIYQKDKLDQWIHKYSYDEDNRITSVSTSKDGYIWQKDAKYKFLLHGPIARTELGDREVQGIDFAYTIQGWLKNVNSDGMDARLDMGKDGLYASYGYGNENVARDAYGFSLQYFEGDYTPANLFMRDPYNSAISVNKNVAYSLTSDVSNNIISLYNGNISHMVTSLPEANLYSTSKTILPKPLATTYYYDQLNRLNEVRAFDNYATISTNCWSISGQTGKNQYAEYFKYDANGNMDTVKRNGNNTGTTMPMDEMIYRYNVVNNRLQDNKLYHVSDLVSGTNYVGIDIDDQGAYPPSAGSTYNYAYDEVGNLISNKSEEILNIEWTLNGMVKRITRIPTSSKPDIEFGYDANNRSLYKLVKPRIGGNVSNQKDWKYTWYVNEVTGYPFSIYEEKFSEEEIDGINYFVDKLILKEQIIYGGSREGTTVNNIEIAIDKSQLINYNSSGNGKANLGTHLNGFPAVFLLQANSFAFFSGYKRFELGNHLGNVLSVVSDRKMMVDVGTYNNGNFVNTILDNQSDYYDPEYHSLNMYYAFGAPLPGKEYKAPDPFGGVGGYKFGFNGQLNENDLYGDGNANSYQFRVADNRLGRFFSVDPLSDNFPFYSPFQFAGNMPIWAIELEGLEPKKTTNPSVWHDDDLNKDFTISPDVNTDFELDDQKRLVAYRNFVGYFTWQTDHFGLTSECYLGGYTVYAKPKDNPNVKAKTRTGGNTRTNENDNYSIKKPIVAITSHYGGPAFNMPTGKEKRLPDIVISMNDNKGTTLPFISKAAQHDINKRYGLSGTNALGLQAMSELPCYFGWGSMYRTFGGAAAKTVITSTTKTVLYRAVDLAEETSIRSTGKFSLKLGGTEVKYFAKSVEDANWYGQRLYPNGYTIIEASTTKPVGAYWFPHTDIGNFAFPNHFLPYIRPH